MNIRQVLQIAREQLALSESPEIDAKYLLCHVLDCDELYLHTWPDRAIKESELQLFNTLLARREAGEPVAYLIERRGFWTLDLTVSSATLIPRPDTEILVETALTKIESQMTIADLGTGTGAIALSIASERQDITIFASDKSEAALAIAADNKQKLAINKVHFWRGDWLTAIADNSLDMVLSNPPYIDKADPHLQQGDVQFEPISALVAEDKGLSDIAMICEQAKRCLKQKGWLMVEHGYQQGQAVQALLLEQNFQKVESIKDYGGQVRITIGQLSV